MIRKSKDTADDYFLAGRNLGWFIVGASIFASNIGSEHLVGLAGSGCTDGVAMAHYELHAWCLLVLGWVMVPFYTRSMVFTMPEFLERRFNATARWVLSIISLVAYVLTKIAVGIFAGGIVFGTLLPELQLDLGFMVLDSFWIGSILVIVLTGIYTVLGGLRAVAYTEALQTVILVVGSVLVTVFGLQAPGRLGASLREICGSRDVQPLEAAGARGRRRDLGAGHGDRRGRRNRQQAWYFNGNYPWLGMLFCAPIIGLWYWCTDQYIVQRALGAPNEREARRGQHLRRLPEAAAGVHLHHPRHDLLRPGRERQGRGARAGCSYEDGKLDRRQVPGGLPADGQARPARRRSRDRRGRAAVGADEFAGRRVQRLAPRCSPWTSTRSSGPSASQHQLVWIGRVATTAMVLIGLAWIPVIQGATGCTTTCRACRATWPRRSSWSSSSACS